MIRKEWRRKRRRVPGIEEGQGKIKVAKLRASSPKHRGIQRIKRETHEPKNNAGGVLRHTYIYLFIARRLYGIRILSLLS